MKAKIFLAQKKLNKRERDNRAGLLEIEISSFQIIYNLGIRFTKKTSDKVVLYFFLNTRCSSR